MYFFRKILCMVLPVFFLGGIGSAVKPEVVFVEADSGLNYHDGNSSGGSHESNVARIDFKVPGYKISKCKQEKEDKGVGDPLKVKGDGIEVTLVLKPENITTENSDNEFYKKLKKAKEELSKTRRMLKDVYTKEDLRPYDLEKFVKSFSEISINDLYNSSFDGNLCFEIKTGVCLDNSHLTPIIYQKNKIIEKEKKVEFDKSEDGRISITFTIKLCKVKGQASYLWIDPYATKSTEPEGDLAYFKDGQESGVIKSKKVTASFADPDYVLDTTVANNNFNQRVVESQFKADGTEADWVKSNGQPRVTNGQIYDEYSDLLAKERSDLSAEQKAIIDPFVLDYEKVIGPTEIKDKLMSQVGSKDLPMLGSVSAGSISPSTSILFNTQAPQEVDRDHSDMFTVKDLITFKELEIKEDIKNSFKFSGYFDNKADGNDPELLFKKKKRTVWYPSKSTSGPMKTKIKNDIENAPILETIEDPISATNLHYIIYCNEDEPELKDLKGFGIEFVIQGKKGEPIKVAHIGRFVQRPQYELIGSTKKLINGKITVKQLGKFFEKMTDLLEDYTLEMEYSTLKNLVNNLEVTEGGKASNPFPDLNELKHKTDFQGEQNSHEHEYVGQIINNILRIIERSNVKILNAPSLPNKNLPTTSTPVQDFVCGTKLTTEQVEDYAKKLAFSAEVTTGLKQQYENDQFDMIYDLTDQNNYLSQLVKTTGSPSSVIRLAYDKNTQLGIKFSKNNDEIEILGFIFKKNKDPKVINFTGDKQGSNESGTLTNFIKLIGKFFTGATAKINETTIERLVTVLTTGSNSFPKFDENDFETGSGQKNFKGTSKDSTPLSTIKAIFGLNRIVVEKKISPQR